MKLYDLFYWNKHRYEWIWIGMSRGDTAYDAIRLAKQDLKAAVARNDVMKVVEYRIGG